MTATREFPQPGSILWAVDVELEDQVFRRGAASKPNVEFLRYLDLGVEDIPGRIEGDMTEKYVVSPGKGISLFLERMAPPGMVLADDNLRQIIEKSRLSKIHWWTIDQGHPIPTGLVLKYDGEPPGHCTLTVTREMTVKAFLALVAFIPFSPLGYNVYAPA